jgi:hypothetical protein
MLRLPYKEPRARDGFTVKHSVTGYEDRIDINLSTPPAEHAKAAYAFVVNVNNVVSCL